MCQNMFPTKPVLFQCKFNVDKLLMEEKLKNIWKAKTLQIN